MVIVPILAALASAAAFSSGSALQHRTVENSTSQESSARSLFTRVLRRPSWLIGLGLSALAFCLHGLALSRGDLVLVQPIIVSGIVFAVLIRAGLERRWPRGRIMLWLVLTWVGLALFLVVRPPTDDHQPRPGLAAVLVGAIVLVVVVVWILAARAGSDRRRGVLLGLSAGLLFGAVAGLLKLVLVEFGDGLVHVLANWPLWTLIVVGVAAVVSNQRAYQVTRLSVSAPVLNVAEVLSALLIGVVVFGEAVGASVGVVIGEVVGLAVMITGIVQLASSDGPES